MARSWTRAGATRFLIRLGASARRHFDYAVDIALDAVLGIRTYIPVPPEPIDLRARNGRYEPLPYRAMRTIARHLDPLSNEVVIDLGCGKGRTVCLFALLGVAKSVGIDVSPALCVDAQANARALRWPHAPIEITNADACEADIGEASLIFMYNPFSAEVMRPMLAHIRESLRSSPRELRICYANPVEAAVLEECSWLVCVDEFLVTYNGWRAAPVKIWTARPELLDRALESDQTRHDRLHTAV